MESIEWEGALLSPLAGSTKDDGVSGAVSVSLIRTRSQGLRECASTLVRFVSWHPALTPPS